MRIPGIKTAKIFSRWLQARVLGGALILGYHRVAKVTRDAYEVCVTPDHFSEHMEIVNKYARPISVAKLAHCLKAGSPPPKSVAVTFDDGYVDNLYNAKPILEKYEIPATVFVCTGYLGREFWWDELERLVMSSQAHLGALHLQVEESQFAWDQLKGSPDADADVRRKFCRALYNFLLTLDVEEQDQAMKTIRSWAGVSSQDATSRTLNHDELLRLTDGGLIELGAHTRHHPMLSQLSLERQTDEIVSSKQDLEEWLGRQVDGFSYPNGRADENAKQIVREAGFAFACTSLHDVIRRGSDLHELTRFWQRDVDGDRFMQALRLWVKMA
ncbi:MAG: polysaccharide deacetylase family protein [Chloroflexota bacterium]|nr:polysaccharide deacetylase family protein [Chloroflexota bacterium]